MAGLMEQLKTITDVNEILAMTEREFKAIIGIAPAAFVKLLDVFQESEEELKQKAEAERTSPRKRKAGGGRKRTLRTPASRVGFILQGCISENFRELCSQWQSVRLGETKDTSEVG